MVHIFLLKGKYLFQRVKSVQKTLIYSFIYLRMFSRYFREFCSFSVLLVRARSYGFQAFKSIKRRSTY